MKKTSLTSGFFGAGRAEAMKRSSDRAQLRHGLQAFGDISSIMSITQREQADMILLRDMLVHDAKAVMGLTLFAKEKSGLHLNTADLELALSEGSAFTLAEQFEIGLPVARTLHGELKALQQQVGGSRAAATERADQILTEYELEKAVPGIGHTELKKKVRGLLMREYSDADYDTMRAYLSKETRNPPANEVEEAAALIIQLAAHRLKQAGMDAVSSLCGYITDAGGVESGIIDLYDEMQAAPMRIDAMHGAHEKNKKIVKKCEAALPVLRESAAALKERFPDEEIAKAYKVPSRELFRAAEQAIENLPEKEPVKGALERLGGIDESTILGNDDRLNVELGARMDNANGMSRSLIGATTAYTEGGEGLGRTIRPFRNKLDERSPEKAREKLLKGGVVSVENQDAIFTFRALDKMYETYLQVGEQEVEHIKRIRTEYADKLTEPQTRMLDQMEKDYAVLLEHVPKAQGPLKKAHENLMTGLHEDDYYIGRFKVESLVRYVEGFLEAAQRREKKFERFEERNPPKKAALAAS